MAGKRVKSPLGWRKNALSVWYQAPVCGLPPRLESLPLLAVSPMPRRRTRQVHSCSWGGTQSCPSTLGLREPGPRALGKSPDSSQTPTLPGKSKGTTGQRRESPRGTWAAVTREESCTSFSSWVSTSRSGAPSASRSGTWSKGLRMEVFLRKLLGCLHRVSPKTKHTSLGAGPRPLSLHVAWQVQMLLLGMTHLSTGG